MFWQIFLFELNYRIRRPATWIYFIIFFLYGFIAIATGSTPASEKVMHNAPLIIANATVFFSMIAMLVCSAIMGVPLFRDIEHQTRYYLYSLPMTKAGYFWGRFLGSFVFVLIIGSGLSWGMYAGSGVGPFFGWVPAERIGHYGLWNYFQPYFLFGIGNLLLSSAIFFALVSLTRNVKVIYTASIFLLIGYLLANFLVQDIENRDLVKLLDPFAINTFDLETKFFTPVEKNTLLTPLTKSILLNRILWISASLLIIALAYWRFSFQKFLQPEQISSRKKKEEKVVPAPSAIKNVHPNFGKWHWQKIVWNLSKIEFLSIFKDNYFKAILGGGIVFLLIDFWIGNTYYGVGNNPLTVFLMDYKNYNYTFFIFIIILFYTGEAVHREKSTKFNIINDAMPVPNTVFYLSKLLALLLIALVLCTIPIVTGVIVQTLKGFTDYDFSVYLIEMYLLTFPIYVGMIFLSFAVHIIVNNKFGGHGIALLIWLTMFMLRSFANMDYNLFFYFYTPNYMWSDMNGIGHFMKPQTWFNFYWLMLGALFVTLAFLFYRRGITGGFKERWRVAMQRFKGWSVVLTSLFFIAWIGSGAYIYYNVSILNNYYSVKENRKNLVLYEKTLKKYEDLAQPKATSIILNAAIYPVERKVEIDAKVTIKNKSEESIPVLHLMAGQNVDYNMVYNGKKINYTSPLAYNYSSFTFFKSGKDTFNYRIYTLPSPLQPGDSALMEIHSEIANHGFVNSGLSREIVYNGTFFAGGLPVFGYAPENELESDEYRKKYGLPPKTDDLPEQDDPKGRNRLLFNNSADLIHFEATISTTPDQIAIAPGYLQKTWMQDGRRYFSYIQDSPIQAFFSLVSAKYEVAKDSVITKEGKNIAIEIFHDQKHPFNIDRFTAALKDGIQYFSETYGPFQFRQMRVLEFPRYDRFAQSFPNTVPFAESFGWVADFNKPDDFDYVYFVTAHELAHQWWGHQVTPNDTRGSNLISEALAEYSALILTERKFGKDNMKRFLKQEVDNYLTGRANEAKKENVFLYCNRPYQWYYKGSIILYGLRDLIGDSALNNALHEFRDSFALKENPPFPGSYDLYRFIKRHTPDSIHYYLTDTWEKITLYENKFISAKAKEVGKNEYDVTLEFKTGKLYADSSGKETVAPMNDYIDVAIFGEETTDKAGRKKVNPIYIKKYKLTAGTKKMVIRVKGKPVKAGIDPYNKLIDRIPDDNQGDVEIE